MLHLKYTVLYTTDEKVHRSVYFVNHFVYCPVYIRIIPATLLGIINGLKPGCMENMDNTKMKRSPKRGQILTTAFELFKENGFFATGVDQIMRTAEVSKRTLYKYFPSKNDLIVAVLEYYRKSYRDKVNDLLEQGQKTSKDKILAIFDDAMTWFDDANFHGCLAVNAMSEFSGKEQTIENTCQDFKQWELGVIRNLTEGISVSDPEALAFKLFILLEGMSSIAQVTKGKPPVDMTLMANELIESYMS